MDNVNASKQIKPCKIDEHEISARETEMENLNNLTEIWSLQRKVGERKFKMAEQNEDAI